MAFLILLIVIGAVAYRLTTPEQRTKALRQAAANATQLKTVVDERRRQGDPFRDALRTRTRWVVIAPALAAISVVMFVRMAWDGSGLEGTERLIAWGASFGPRTTNGEWWRLASSLFAHAGFIHLVVDLLAMVPLALLLERLVGRTGFAAAFLSAGVFANLARVSADPIGIHAGASGAIYGMYGMLLASALWSLVQRSTLMVPLRALTPLVPGLVLLLLYYGFPGAPEIVGGVVGLACGVWLGRAIGEHKPAMRRVAVSAGVAATLAIAAAVPIRGVTDVRPELANVIAVEERTSQAYDAARNRFTKGALPREKLIALIDQTILPELEQTRKRLDDLDGVPEMHAPLVKIARDFVQMRDDSWRLRADGLRKTNMLALRKADAAEQLARAALDALKPPTPPPTVEAEPASKTP